MQLIMDSYVADAIIIKHAVTRYNIGMLGKTMNKSDLTNKGDFVGFNLQQIVFHWDLAMNTDGLLGFNHEAL